MATYHKYSDDMTQHADISRTGWNTHVKPKYTKIRC